jgi:phage shock protein A
MAEAHAGVTDAVKEIDLTDPTSELSRFEEKIRRGRARPSRIDEGGVG